MAGKFDMTKTTTKPDTGAQLFVLYGKENVGKTWLICTIPALFIIALERLKGIINPAPHFPTQPRTFRELIEAIDAFEAGNPPDANGKRPFRHLAIDSTTTLESFILAQSLVDEGVGNMGSDFQKGWGRAQVLWNQLFTRLETLRLRSGVHVWLVAHGHQVDEAAHDGSVYKTWDLRLEKKAAPLVRSQADHVLFMDVQVLVTKGGKGKRSIGQDKGKIIRTRGEASFFAKTKSGMPATVGATWPELQKALAANVPAPSEKLRTKIGEACEKLTPEDRAAIETDLAAAGDDARRLSEVLSRAQGLIAAAEAEEPAEAEAEPLGASETPPASGETATPPVQQDEQQDGEEEDAPPLDFEQPEPRPSVNAIASLAARARPGPAPTRPGNMDGDLLAIIAAATAPDDVRAAITTAVATLPPVLAGEIRVAGYRKLLELAGTAQQVNLLASEIAKLPADELAELKPAVGARIATVKGRAA